VSPRRTTLPSPRLSTTPFPTRRSSDLLGLLIAGWTAGGSFIITPILYSGMSLIYPPKFIWFEWFLSLALAGLGILMCLGMYQMTKLTIHAFMRYLHWNYRMVKGGQTS